MIETYEMTQTKCDACGVVKETPMAISGYYDSGWREIDGKDLCSVCFGMFGHKMVSYLKEKNLLEKMLKEHIDQTKPRMEAPLGTTYC